MRDPPSLGAWARQVPPSLGAWARQVPPSLGAWARQVPPSLEAWARQVPPSLGAWARQVACCVTGDQTDPPDRIQAQYLCKGCSPPCLGSDRAKSIGSAQPVVWRPQA